MKILKESFILCAALLLFACGDNIITDVTDDDDSELQSLLVGTWQIESIKEKCPSTEEIDVILSDCRELQTVTFTADDSLEAIYYTLNDEDSCVVDFTEKGTWELLPDSTLIVTPSNNNKIDTNRVLTLNQSDLEFRYFQENDTCTTKESYTRVE